MNHPLTKIETDNLAQTWHHNTLTLRTGHVDSPRSARNPVVSLKNADFSVVDRSHISKHGSNDLHDSRQSVDNQATGFSFLDEQQIKERSFNDGDDHVNSDSLPGFSWTFGDEPHINKRSGGEGDDEQGNEQDDHHHTPPDNAKLEDLKWKLWNSKDGPRHKHRGL